MNTSTCSSRDTSGHWQCCVTTSQSAVGWLFAIARTNQPPYTTTKRSSVGPNRDALAIKAAQHNSFVDITILILVPVIENHD